MNDDQILLANAYFDGQLDAAERARAEADAVVLAEVDRLTALAVALGDVSAPTDTAREAAIAAALGEFDRLHSPRSTVVPITHSGRSRTSTWLAVAAGVLGIGLFGVVVAQNGLGGSDDDDAGVAADAARDLSTELPAESAKTEASAERATASATAEAALEVATATLAPAAADSAAAGAPAEQAAESTAAEESAGDSATAEASANDTDQQMTTASQAVWVFDPAVAIPNTAALADVGAELTQQEQDGTLGTTPETSCGTDPEQPLSVLDTGLYQLPDGTVVPVEIGVDRSTGATYAIDPDSCETLAVATP